MTKRSQQMQHREKRIDSLEARLGSLVIKVNTLERQIEMLLREKREREQQAARSMLVYTLDDMKGWK